MRHLTTEERRLVERVESKWTDTCSGLMHFTGSMRPLLMLEFQGYLDYLKVVENKISFWEMKTLEINHQVGPCNFDNRIITLDATSHLEVYLPGKIGEVSIHLAYSSNKEKQEPFCRWKAIVSDNEK